MIRFISKDMRQLEYLIAGTGAGKVRRAVCGFVSNMMDYLVLAPDAPSAPIMSAAGGIPVLDQYLDQNGCTTSGLQITLYNGARFGLRSSPDAYEEIHLISTAGRS